MGINLTWSQEQDVVAAANIAATYGVRHVDSCKAINFAANLGDKDILGWLSNHTNELKALGVDGIKKSLMDGEGIELLVAWKAMWIMKDAGHEFTLELHHNPDETAKAIMQEFYRWRGV